MRGGLGSRPIRHHHHHHHKYTSFLLFPEWDLPLRCRAISAIARAPCVFSPTLLFFLFPFALQIESSPPAAPRERSGGGGAVDSGRGDSDSASELRPGFHEGVR